MLRSRALSRSAAGKAHHLIPQTCRVARDPWKPVAADVEAFLDAVGVTAAMLVGSPRSRPRHRRPHPFALSLEPRGGAGAGRG